MPYSDDVLIEGTKEPGELGTARAFIDDRPLEHVVHHSPDGFEWGYGGSGPADLSLSILAAVLGPEPEQVKIFSGSCGRRAWMLHQQFKREFVATWGDDWQITVGAVRSWIRRH